jgi:hypothetical protein
MKNQKTMEIPDHIKIKNINKENNWEKEEGTLVFYHVSCVSLIGRRQ